MAEPFDYRLKRALEAEQASIAEAVMKGGPEDFASYRYEIGRVRGIQFAIDMLAELVESMAGEDGF